MSLFNAKHWNAIAELFCGFGILMMLIALGLSAYRAWFLNSATATQGTITDLFERIDEEGGTLYAPVYVFQDENGNEVKIISSTASWPPVGQVGDPIEVLYLPENPKRAITNRFFEKWGVAFIVGLIGLIEFLLFGLIAYSTGRYLNARKNANSAE